MKNIFVLQLLVVFIVSASVSGCSTVFGRHQDDQMVTFDANIQNVEVLCSGKRVQTPGSIPLKQSKSHSCVASAPGYDKKAFRIRSGSSWSGFGHSTATNTAIWGWWTLGIGTGIGWLIDWPSGAMRNLKEDSIYIDMKPAGTTNVAVARAANVSKAVVSAPVEIVQTTTTAVLDPVVHGTSQELGIEESDWEENKS